jgi:hypothetical protein
VDCEDPGQVEFNREFDAAVFYANERDDRRRECIRTCFGHLSDPVLDPRRHSLYNVWSCGSAEIDRDVAARHLVGRRPSTCTNDRRPCGAIDEASTMYSPESSVFSRRVPSGSAITSISLGKTTFSPRILNERTSCPRRCSKGQHQVGSGCTEKRREFDLDREAQGLHDRARCQQPPVDFVVRVDHQQLELR